MIDLICAGETFEDVIFHDLQEWPRLGEEFKTHRLVRTWGGGALLTAVAAARQHTSCQVVSLLAPAAERFLRKEGLRVRNLRRPEEPHAITVGLSTREDRAFVTYPGMNDELEGRLLQVLPRLKARHIHLALEPRCCQSWINALQAIRQRGITTSWDFGWNSALLERPCFVELTGSVDYLLLNQKEAECYGSCAHWEEVCAHWQNRARCVILKLGSRGCVGLFEGKRYEVASTPVEALDSTGAGDAFNGGILEGLPLNKALELGNHVGAASTLHAGGLAGLPHRVLT